MNNEWMMVTFALQASAGHENLVGSLSSTNVFSSAGRLFFTHFMQNSSSGCTLASSSGPHPQFASLAWTSSHLGTLKSLKQLKFPFKMYLSHSLQNLSRWAGERNCFEIKFLTISVALSLSNFHWAKHEVSLSAFLYAESGSKDGKKAEAKIPRLSNHKTFLHVLFSQWEAFFWLDYSTVTEGVLHVSLLTPTGLLTPF